MPTNPGISEVQDKNGVVADIEAKRFDGTRTVNIQGDITATQTWNGDSNTELTLNASIGAKKVTTDKINDKAVQTGQIDDGAVGLSQIATNAMNGTVQDNDSKLATHASVKTYVDAQISGQGTYLGKHTVAEINAMVTDNLHNGDRVMTSDSGTVNLGPGGVGFDVEAGEDLILYKSGSTVQWDSMDGNFKTKQTAVSDPTASGTGLTFIDSISQDENGEITPSKKTVQDGTTSQKGVVQLEDSYSSTSTTKAATPNSVKSAYDLANTANTGLANKLDKTGDGKDVTATFTEASTRANIGTGEKLSVMFGKIKKWFTDLKALAFKDTVSDSDISGTISDNHIASASTWNGKADKVSGATNGDLAELDSNGNLTDSGKKTSDFEQVTNKVTSWQTTPDYTHYPSEKLVKDALDAKVNIANIDLDGKTTTILAEVQALAIKGVHYARFYTRGDGGAVNISDKPVSDLGFLCEVVCNRFAGTTNYRYLVTCWVGTDKNPYWTHVTGATESINWSRLNAYVPGTPTNNNLVAMDANGLVKDGGVAVLPSTSTWDGTSDAKVPTAKAVQAKLDQKASGDNFVAAYGVRTIQLRYSVAAAVYDGHFVTIMNGYGGLSYRNITFALRKSPNGAPSVYRYNTEVSSNDYSDAKNFAVYYGADPLDANYGILLIIPTASIYGLLHFSTATSAKWSTFQSALDTEGLTALTPVEHTNVFGANKGSASVPVYVNASGAATPCTDTFVNNITYVANQSGGGGNLNKTINGTTTSVLAFMNDSEAVAIWADAKNAAANAS